MKNTVLIHYKAFGSNIMFQFTHESVLDPDLSNENLLETIFRQCNHVDGNEWISLDFHARSLRLRSMSVGDEVIFLRNGFERYRCESCGWAKIEETR